MIWNEATQLAFQFGFGIPIFAAFSGYGLGVLVELIRNIGKVDSGNN